MCGISCAFVRSKEHKYWDLLRNSEIRGQDGTGFVVWHKQSHGGYFTVHRSEKKASEFEGTMLDLKLKDFIVGQNRLAIFGLGSENNQPLVTEKTILVHNGNLLDFEKTFKKEKLKREYTVDSELILRLWEKYYDIDEVKKRLKGDYACILVDRIQSTVKPKKSVYIFTKYKPVYYYKDSTGLYFYSTGMIGKKTFGVEGTPLKNGEVIIKNL